MKKAVCPDCGIHIPVLLDINSSVDYKNIEDSTQTNIACLNAQLVIYCPNCRSTKKIKVNYYFEKSSVYATLGCGELLALALANDWLYVK